MIALTKSAVDQFALEQTTLELVNEFLGGYFDGNPHAVGGRTLTFPKVELAYQQSAVSQPLHGVAITTVWTQGGKTWRGWETIGGARQQMFYTRTTMNFWVRGQGQATAQGTANARCQQAMDLLQGLLLNPDATRALAQKGISHLRPEPGGAVMSADYVMRLIRCEAHLRYPVKT